MDNLDQLASKVFAILGEAGIPAEIIGGYALSHYGYVRNTVDIDIIVRDHVAAVETLKAHGFTEAKHWFMLQDPSLPGVKVDVLPGGRTISGNTQANPMPSSVSDVPAFISLQDLVRLKLGVVVYNGGVYRGCSDETIRFEYEEIWDRNSAPRKESALDPFADFFKVEED
jgi:hypothetical protein